MKQYLIVERLCGDSYVYIEDEKTFKVNSAQRFLKGRRTENDLAQECELSTYPDGAYFVFELKEKKNVKTQKKTAAKTRKVKSKATAKKAKSRKSKKVGRRLSSTRT